MKKPVTGPLSLEEVDQIVRRRSKHLPGVKESSELMAAAIDAENEAVAVMVEAMSTRDIGGRLVAMSSAATRAARTSPDPAASRTRATLRSLQFFEHAIGMPSGFLHPPRHYLKAGETLVGPGLKDENGDYDEEKGGGDPDGGAILQGFAVQLFTPPGREHDPALASTCRERWRERHNLREMFPYDHPNDRGGLEEQILARLLRHPDDAALRDLVTGDTFTSDLRAEAWHAASGGDPALARDRFTAAMLRAPGWALPDTGWPGHDRAHRLLERLLATPVSDGQARSAAETVAAMQKQAENDCGIVLTPDSDLRLLARRPDRIKEAGITLAKPPPPEDETVLNVSLRIHDPDLERAIERGDIPNEFRFFGDMPGPRPARAAPEPGVADQDADRPQDPSSERISVPRHRQAPEPRTLIAPPPLPPAPAGPTPAH